MICYLCDSELQTPSNTYGIFACPFCKRNILINGDDSELVSQLKNQILTLKISNNSKEEIIQINQTTIQNQQCEISQMAHLFNENNLLKKENDYLLDELYYLQHDR